MTSILRVGATWAFLIPLRLAEFIVQLVIAAPADQEAALGPIDGRAAYPDAPCDLLVTGAGIRSQQKRTNN
jgi:hypothetical protein